MFARIFQPAKTAMQSGKAKADRWVLEFEAKAARRVDPLMGWTSTEDTTAGQVRLFFDSKAAAVTYAESRNIPFQLAEANEASPVAKAYSDNFAFRRRRPWTH
ncbi:MAG: ETC complex I subunit [Parvularculaceae bacterium]|nr:ETC complex I subunit [Parvularculaceae bacterium]